jgi:hypothetical protein
MRTMIDLTKPAATQTAAEPNSRPARPGTAGKGMFSAPPETDPFASPRLCLRLGADRWRRSEWLGMRGHLRRRSMSRRRDADR